MEASIMLRFYESVDTYISTSFFSLLNFMGVHLTSTPLTKGLPTVDSPTPVLLGMFIYITSVLSGLMWIRAANLKPRLHQPLLLKALVILHNLFCLSLSLYMSLGIAFRAFQLNYSLWGNAYDPKEDKMAHFIYLFYMSKYVEFMDTIIMLLKRNLRQVSVLHVYHHMSVALIWWMLSHHAPGGDA
eukprot:c19587_g2_i1 orf=1-555(-)